MRNSKQDAEDNADATYGNIGNPKEGILPSHHSACGDNNGFRPTIYVDRKVYNSR